MNNFNAPKDNEKFSWTKHSIEKMKFYNFSAQRITRVINNPERKEEAVAPGCVAVAQTVGNKRKTEIWVMYKQIGTKINNKFAKPKVRIISAWRYPGISPKRGVIPIPEDVLEELENMVE
jgi:hypothetical protein